MTESSGAHVHLIVGGYPPGTAAAHDMDYARRRLLGLLAELPMTSTTVANDFRDIDRWLDGTQLLITYVAGRTGKLKKIVYSGPGGVTTLEPYEGAEKAFASVVEWAGALALRDRTHRDRRARRRSSK